MYEDKNTFWRFISFFLTVLALQPYYIYAENDKTDEADPIELYVSPEEIGRASCRERV